MTLAERLARAMARAPAAPLLTGDDSRLADIIDGPTAAAVLVAVTDRPEPGIMLTQRTETLRHHAGQVAFPGGRADPGDTDLIATALREADEEIGLPPRAVTVVGTTDRYRTVTGFDVTPVLGVIPPDLALRPAEAEVASLFEVPLAYLLNPEHHRRVSVPWNGQTRHYYEILWNERRIWGATAAMIVNLSRRLQ
ncbi:CoA pyrophosphatase [Sphingomonadaceae bacterium jetA1]|jgi:8-oxo-dGTP pyrophosphatase MutT (NUDIX family)|uniref:CoA pyrophosphatase n=1 Tax=Facivitalis istanbulensis TaxID=3075838 RepID=UPI003480D549